MTALTDEKLREIVRNEGRNLAWSSTSHGDISSVWLLSMARELLELRAARADRTALDVSLHNAIDEVSR